MSQWKAKDETIESNALKYSPMETSSVHFFDETTSAFWTHGRGLDNPVVWWEAMIAASGRLRIFDTPLEISWFERFSWSCVVASVD
jgi:hypothetical protein